MMTFLESNKFSKDAVEGIVEILFGDLTPEEAIRLNADYSQLSEEDKMLTIVNHISEIHFKNILI